jgi:DNA-directed RNA polymerase subunit RPC12/RpoP
MNKEILTELTELMELTCKRCNHKWIPRTKMPVACPQCKSRLWNKDYKFKNPNLKKS